jgi:hypothetical protein
MAKRRMATPTPPMLKPPVTPVSGASGRDTPGTRPRRIHPAENRCRAAVGVARVASIPSDAAVQEGKRVLTNARRASRLRFVGLHSLEHDHVTLSQAVAELRAQAAAGRPGFPDDEFIGKLQKLAEELFEHFAREEEGLFPFISKALPDQAEAIAQMQAAHDRICGAASRIAQLGDRPSAELALSLFQRFDAEYTGHAQREAEFLRSLSSRLTKAQRSELASVLYESG